MGMKGTLVTLKENVFKQGNKISKTPVYPIFLSELSVIESINMDCLGEDYLTPREGN